MRVFARMFEHSPRSASIAKERLNSVLSNERMRISPSTQSVSVSFRGTREGLCITLGNGEWNQVLTELAVQLNRRDAESYFRGARVHLETGNRIVSSAQLEELVALLSQHEMSLSSVIGQVKEGHVAVRRPSGAPPPKVVAPSAPKLPFPTQTRLPPPPAPLRPAIGAAGPDQPRARVPQPPKPLRPSRMPRPAQAFQPAELAEMANEAEVPPERLAVPATHRRNGERVDNPLQASQALLIRRTVRSGQVVHYPGTIVVFGDVNPAAEVIAEGDVIILGKLRGVVHAGASGNDNAVVGALILAPTQVRIGDQVARAPDDKRWHPWPAEIARVRGGQIIVEPWGVA